jgi:hypothetical protein
MCNVMRRRCMNRGLAFRAAVCATHVHAPFVCTVRGKSQPCPAQATALRPNSTRHLVQSQPLDSEELSRGFCIALFLSVTLFYLSFCLPRWRPHGTCLPLLPPSPPHGAKTTSHRLHATTLVLPSYALCQSRLPQSAHSLKKDGIRQPCAKRPPTPMRTRSALSRPIELLLRTCLAWVGSFNPFQLFWGSPSPGSPPTHSVRTGSWLTLGR